MSQACEESVKRDLLVEDESEQGMSKKQKLDESIDTVASESPIDESEVVGETREIVEEVPQKAHDDDSSKVTEQGAEEVVVASAACPVDESETSQSVVDSVEAYGSSVECVASEKGQL